MNMAYYEMSRDELCQVIGVDVDPSVSRGELITMAMQRDINHFNQE